MTKLIENQKNRPAMDLKLLFCNFFLIFTRQDFLKYFMTQSGPAIFHLETGCIVNNNEFIPDKAVWYLKIRIAERFEKRFPTPSV